VGELMDPKTQVEDLFHHHLVQQNCEDHHSTRLPELDHPVIFLLFVEFYQLKEISSQSQVFVFERLKFPKKRC